MLRSAAQALGSPAVLLLSFAAVGTGYLFGWSESWWSWIDRAVFLVTMWGMFIVQNAQNRDTEAIEAKLDELLRAIPDADNGLRGIEKQ